MCGITVLIQPWLLIVLVAIAFFYMWAAARESISIGKFSISGTNKTWIVSLVSVILILVVAGSSIPTLAGVTSLIIFVHAIAHEIVLETDVEVQANPGAVTTSEVSVAVVGQVEVESGEKN